MKALLVVDMQVGLLESQTPPRDVSGIVQRINDVAQAVRESHGMVIFVQHHGPNGDIFAPNNSGWHILPSLEQTEHDRIVAKTTCDAFYKTELDSLLKEHKIDELLISGWATDFCVDTTIRAAASLEYSITVLSDAHTAADRPHLDAASIIRHHNLTWTDMIVPGRQINVVTADAVLQRLRVTKPASLA